MELLKPPPGGGLVAPAPVPAPIPTPPQLLNQLGPKDFLQKIFPSVNPNVLELVYQGCGGSLERAIEQLVSGCRLPGVPGTPLAPTLPPHIPAHPRLPQLPPGADPGHTALSGFDRKLPGDALSAFSQVRSQSNGVPMHPGPHLTHINAAYQALLARDQVEHVTKMLNLHSALHAGHHPPASTSPGSSAASSPLGQAPSPASPQPRPTSCKAASPACSSPGCRTESPGVAPTRAAAPTLSCSPQAGSTKPSPFSVESLLGK